MTEIQRSGRFTVDQPRDTVIEFLRDRERVVRCLPDRVESVTRLGDAVRVVVRVGVSAVRTRVHLTLRKHEDGEKHIWYTGHGVAARSRVELDGHFTVDAADDGTVIEWRGEARITGILASLGETPGRYDDIVAGKIDAAIENVHEALTG